MTDTSGDAQDGAQPAASESAPDPIEALAVKFGWKPKTDDFQGEHLDPLAFIETQPDRLRAAKEKAAKASDTAQRATKTAASAITKAKAEIRRQVEAEIRTATEAGDADAVLKATERLVEASAAPSGEVEDFKSRNSWFDKDDEATAFAVTLTNRLATQGLSVKDQLEEAEKAVKKRFPELFEEEPDKPARKPPLVTPGQTNAPLSFRKKGLADVPAQIRNAWTPRICKLFGSTPAEMADTYWKDNA